MNSDQFPRAGGPGSAYFPETPSQNVSVRVEPGGEPHAPRRCRVEHGRPSAVELGSRMALDFGKWLFPHRDRYRRRQQMRMILVSLLFGLVASGIIALVMVIADRRML